MNATQTLWFQKPRVIISALVALALVVLAASAVFTYTGTRNAGREQEIALSTHFAAMQSSYGQFRLAIADEMKVAQTKQDAMSKIFADAISGRYDRKGEAGTIDTQALIAVIHEAYPDLSGLNIYDKLIADIQAGRKAFAHDQIALQDKLRSYNTWRSTGWLLHPDLVEHLGFPSALLRAQVGDKIYYGQEALDKMTRVIVGADTIEIFESGVDLPMGQ